MAKVTMKPVRYATTDRAGREPRFAIQYAMPDAIRLRVTMMSMANPSKGGDGSKSNK
jgi:hypothetical protein